MNSSFDHFGLFLHSVGDHAFTLAAGCVLTVLVSLFQKHVRKRALPWKVDLVIFLSFIFFACFQAWHDEFVKEQTATSELATKVTPPTPVVVNVPPVGRPEVIVTPSGERAQPPDIQPTVNYKFVAPAGRGERQALVFLALNVLNKGGQGAISKMWFTMTLNGRVLHGVSPAMQDTDQPISFVVSPGHNAVLYWKDLWVHLTNEKPIPANSNVNPWIVLLFPDASMQDLVKGKAKITLYCVDVRGRKTSTTDYLHDDDTPKSITLQDMLQK